MHLDIPDEWLSDGKKIEFVRWLCLGLSETAPPIESIRLEDVDGDQIEKGSPQPQIGFDILIAVEPPRRSCLNFPWEMLSETENAGEVVARLGREFGEKMSEECSEAGASPKKTKETGVD